MKCVSIIIVALLVFGCEGRTTDTQDNRPDEVLADTPKDANIGEDASGIGGDLLTDGYVPTGSWIEQVQGSSASLECTAQKIQNFETGLTGEAVVVSPKFVASAGKLDGYYIATPGLPQAKPLNGVLLAVDVSLGTTFKVGDILAVTADHIEYYCMTELKATAVKATGTGPVPLPLTVSVNDLDSNKAEPLEGVLVRITNVSVTKASVPGSDGKDHGMFEVNGKVVVDTSTFKVSYGASRKVGDEFDEIVGVVAYSFGQYVLQPRSDDDLKFKGSWTDVPTEIAQDAEVTETSTPSVIEEVQKSAESQSCAKPDGLSNYTTGLSLEAVVVTPKFVLSSGKLDGYYIATKGLEVATEWNGILMAVDVAAATDFAIGDLVSLSGAQHIEAYCESELKPSSVVKIGNATTPKPLVVEPTVLADSTLGEPYEGVYVQVQNVEVINANPDAPKNYNNMKVTGELIVKKPSGFNAVEGDKFESITGVLRFGYGYFYLYVWDASLIIKKIEQSEPVPEIPPEATPDVPSDAGPATKTIFEIQNTDASVNCSSETNQVITTGILMGPMVVTSPGIPVAGKTGYFVADPVSTWPVGGTGAWTGCFLIAPTGSPNFVPGDLLTATADHVEYYCMTELMCSSVTKIGTDTIPPEKELDPVLLGNGGVGHFVELEPWEGYVVKLTNLKVTATTPSDSYSWFEVGTADGSVTGIQVMKNSTIAYTPTIDAPIKTLKAPLQYHWGKFRLRVRTIEDIQ